VAAVSATADVVIVGAGPAGLAAADGLARAGADVRVIEREQAAGGIPRHCEHGGFGLRDLRRSLTGPDYAARCAERAAAGGAEIMLGTQVTGWSADGALILAGARGPQTLAARAVLLATGCRERPRAARAIPGSRPRGVFTTGTLQRLVAAGERPVGHRAVIVGAEHVSYSALQTLRHGGARAAVMTTELDRAQTFAAVAAAARLLLRVPLLTRTAIAAVHGRGRVEAVDLLDLGGGGTQRVACDTVILTGDWIPEREVAQLAGVTLDRGTGGPRVDGEGRTDRVGLFAAGNILHGAEPADVAALEGRSVARSIGEYLGGAGWPARSAAIEVAPPLAWIVPNALPVLRDTRFKLRSSVAARRAEVRVEQAGRVIATARARGLAPGRGGRLAADWAGDAEPGEPLTITLASAATRRARAARA